MRAQIAMEYMVMVGMVLFVIVLISGLIWSQSDSDIKTTQAKIAAERIASAAESVYAQGPGAKTEVGIVFPQGYEESMSLIDNNTVIITVSTSAGYNDAVAISRAKMQGSLPGETGYKVITLELINDYVNISSS